MFLQLVFLLGSAKCIVSMETMYEQRSEIGDQASSASGYAYQMHSGAPLVHYGYSPITLGRYTPEIAPVGLQLPVVNSYGLPANPAAYALNPLPLELAKYTPQAVQQGSNFVQGGGSSHDGSNQASNGEKGQSGYQNSQHFNKGGQGKHLKQGEQGHFAKSGGNKAKHHSEGQHYNKNVAEANGAKGGSFHQASSHKKGSKTNGFHRVHHKDEYKKDHTFYDESDNSGHFDKFGKGGASFGAAKGAFVKGGHEAGGFQQAAGGKKGYFDKGRYLNQDSGFNGEEGKKSHFKDFEEYGKNGGQEEQKKFGYSEVDGLSSY